MSRPKLTNEILKKCANELGQVWEFLPQDVRDLIVLWPSHQQVFCSGRWTDDNAPTVRRTCVVRLDPDAPTEQAAAPEPPKSESAPAPQASAQPTRKAAKR